MRRVQKTSRVEVVVAAAISQVWSVVADVTRTGEWSHECGRVQWVTDPHTLATGARFRGHNRAGWVRWTRTSELLSVDPPHELVWRTVPTRLFPDSTIWRIHLEPLTNATRITQSFEVVVAPRLLDLIYARLVPTHQERDALLAQDLSRLGQLARTTSQPP